MDHIDRAFEKWVNDPNLYADMRDAFREGYMLAWMHREEDATSIGAFDPPTVLGLIARLYAAEARVASATSVVKDLLDQWPEGSAPSGPLCVRAAAIINQATTQEPTP
jgi:hypothetical protein